MQPPNASQYYPTRAYNAQCEPQHEPVEYCSRWVCKFVFFNFRAILNLTMLYLPVVVFAITQQ